MQAPESEAFDLNPFGGNDESSKRKRSGVAYIHNIATAHYKVSLFDALANELRSRGICFSVLQLAETERSRAATPFLPVSPRHVSVTLHRGFYEDITAIRKILGATKWLMSQKPMIAVFPGYYDLSLLFVALIAKYVLRIRTVVGIDNNIPPRGENSKTCVKRLLCCHFDGALTYGSDFKKFAQHLIGRKKPILTGVAAIDVSKIRQIEKQTADEVSCRVIYLGRLSGEKGLRHFDKIAEAVSMIPNAEFAIVGSGSSADCLFVRNLLLKRPALRWRLHGALNWQNSIAVLKTADILVLPSDYEPWGLVVNEAAVCGVRVVTSTNVGSNEVIRNINWGRIVSFDDLRSAEIADLFQELKRVRAPCFPEAVPFSAETVAKRLSDFFSREFS